MDEGYSLKKLEDLDNSNMRELVTHFPHMLKSMKPSKGVIGSIEGIREEGCHGILLVGMGGSSIAGAICKGILTNTSVPILLHQDYDLPSFVDQKWVVIGTSYSGNTVETLSACKEAAERHCPIIAVSSGGKLLDMVPTDALQLIPEGFPPRAAFPLIISVLLPFLEILTDSPISDLGSTADSLVKLGRKWEPLSITPKSLAQQVVGRIPVFTGWRHLSAVACRAKCQINENSKTIAYAVEIPEANHNEVEASGTYRDYGVVPVFLRSKMESTHASKRFGATSRILSEQKSQPIELTMNARNMIEEVLSFIFFLDMASVELAELRGVDPMAVERISQLKAALGD